MKHFLAHKTTSWQLCKKLIAALNLMAVAGHCNGESEIWCKDHEYIHITVTNVTVMFTCYI